MDSPVYPFCSGRNFSFSFCRMTKKKKFLRTFTCRRLCNVGFYVTWISTGRGLLSCMGCILSIMLNFIKKYQTVFRNSCSFLRPNQQCTRVPIAPQVYQYLILLGFNFFFILIILISAVASQCAYNLHSLVTRGDEQTSMCLFSTRIFFFGELSVQTFCPFKKIWFLFFSLCPKSFFF